MARCAGWPSPPPQNETWRGFQDMLGRCECLRAALSGGQGRRRHRTGVARCKEELQQAMPSGCEVRASYNFHIYKKQGRKSPSEWQPESWPCPEILCPDNTSPIIWVERQPAIAYCFPVPLNRRPLEKEPEAGVKRPFCRMGADPISFERPEQTGLRDTFSRLRRQSTGYRNPA